MELSSRLHLLPRKRASFLSLACGARDRGQAGVSSARTAFQARGYDLRSGVASQKAGSVHGNTPKRTIPESVAGVVLAGRVAGGGTKGWTEDLLASQGWIRSISS